MDIGNLTVTSVKIAVAGGKTGQDHGRGSGVKIGHIQDEAIDAAKKDLLNAYEKKKPVSAFESIVLHIAIRIATKKIEDKKGIATKIHEGARRKEIKMKPYCFHEYC